MEEPITSVNAEQAGVEGQQQEQPATVQDTGAPAVVAEQQPKPEQTPEQNAVYAQMRRRAEAEAKEAAAAEWKAKLDAFAAEAYGEAGIKTYDQYEEMRRNAQYQQQYGVDPTQLKPLFDEWKQNDPDFVRAREAAATAQIERDVQALAAAFPESGIKTVDDLAASPVIDKIVQFKSAGLSLQDAYFAANRDQIIQAQVKAAVNDALSKSAVNAAASPGALDGGAEPPLSFDSTSIKHLDKARLVSDPAYFKAAMDSLKKLRK